MYHALKEIINQEYDIYIKKGNSHKNRFQKLK